MGSNPSRAIHNCRFILCCDARQCKALQSKQIKKADMHLLGSFEYDEVCINVQAAVVKQFAPCIYIAQYNTSMCSSELGIIMGSNPS